MSNVLKSKVSVAVASMAILSVSSIPAFAQSFGSGTYRAGQCGGTAVFRKAQGTAKNHDIGQTKLVGVIQNTGDGGSGLLLTFSDPFFEGNFQNLQFQFLDTDDTAKKVKVTLCFDDQTGGIVSFTRNINKNDLTITDAGDGWSKATITASNLGFNPKNKWSLFKVTFLLTKPGQISIGATQQVFNNNQTIVGRIEMDATDCSILTDCQ